MKLTFATGGPAEQLGDARTDLLVLAVPAAIKAWAWPAFDGHLAGDIEAELRRQGFSGAAGQAVVVQTHGLIPVPYVLVVGVGDGTGPQPWQQLADLVVRKGRELKARRARVALCGDEWPAVALETLAEGLWLASYSFDELKSKRASRANGLAEVVITATRRLPEWTAALKRGHLLAAATCYARNLINWPAAIVTPAYLAAEARALARTQGVRARVMDERAMARAGMGALLGVAQGSAQAPRFIELVFRPRGRVRRTVALAGKGVTFDSGGLSLKPADAMQAQKRDMAGAAAVLGVMSVLRDLGLPLEVRAYVPATENMPGGRALKPGDVVRAYDGTTIEVLNTDAEGRLILADALAYAAERRPDVLIDLATLTGTVRTALGTRYAAVMGTDPALVQALIAAGKACGENLWELPLPPEYRSDIESSVADLKNVGEGAAGTIIGGLFLKEFTGGVPWAHVDFSSTVVSDKGFACHPRGATGFGVRTVLRYLSSL